MLYAVAARTGSVDYIWQEIGKMKKWQCIVCGWVYDEATGDAEHGLAAGTRWADVPDSFVCPDCGVAKNDFVMMEA
jgi:rubredoxin-NAD+ reductase